MNQPEFKIALVRACPTDWDNQERLTGTLDVPLNENGRSVAVRIARQLEFSSFSVIISAACQSARQTAEILSSELGVRLRVDANLVNQDLGLWQGRQIGELESCQPTNLKQWQESPDQFVPPAGESAEVARERIQRSLRRWSRKYRGCQVILVVPEPLASIVRSELAHDELGDLSRASSLCGRWEWLQYDGQVLA